MLGVAAATTGLAIGLSKFDALYDSLHAKLGLAVGCLIWAQPLLGLIRPHKYFMELPLRLMLLFNLAFTS